MDTDRFDPNKPASNARADADRHRGDANASESKTQVWPRAPHPVAKTISDAQPPQAAPAWSPPPRGGPAPYPPARGPLQPPVPGKQPARVLARIGARIASTLA